ncbi:hypothetical protein F5Y09DRAFT_338264 [Xylaria sp. FL1042]|nr:hypothetical protein F5Y09DRAFT_338264 [Xylaria sp. FL1042]
MSVYPAPLPISSIPIGDDIRLQWSPTGLGWAGVLECANTFGYITHQLLRYYTTQYTDALNKIVLNSSDDFSSAMSNAFDGSDTATYETTANKFQFMMVVPIVSNVSYPHLICMRVNPACLEVSDSESNGDGEGTENMVRYNSDIAIAVTLVWILIAAS